jgi:hypothetical protein
MKKELIVRWMDALIEEWYRIRMLRTLSDDCGAEFCSYIGMESEQKFHLDSDNDRATIGKLADAVGATVEVSEFNKETDEYSFLYKGFRFFAIDGKETE